jgi:hypothetical protein
MILRLRILPFLENGYLDYQLRMGFGKHFLEKICFLESYIIGFVETRGFTLLGQTHGDEKSFLWP